MFVIPSYVDYYEKDGAVFVTSQLLQNTVKLTDPLIIDEFKSLLRSAGCADISTPMQQFLHEQEMLLNEAEIHHALAELYKAMENVLLLTIMPTEGCNFRCPYCYEDHNPISVSRDLLNQIQKYIAEQAASFQRINIAWFGGEPTLCKDTILETNEMVQHLQSEHPFTFSSSMTTNGYLLGADDFKAYYRAGITSYQITLDGWNHDKTRPHITGKGTLQRILDNLTAISALPKEMYEFRIILRHNILLGDEDYSWYDYLKGLFGDDRRFSVLIRPVCDWGGDTVEKLSFLKDEASDELVKKHIDYLQQIGMRCENEQKGLFSQICYASYPNSMVFRSDGRIEKCTVCLNHPQNQVGYIDEDGHVIIDETRNSLWCKAELKKECYQCKDVLTCLNLQCKKRFLTDGTVSNCHMSVIRNGYII